MWKIFRNNNFAIYWTRNIFCHGNPAEVICSNKFVPAISYSTDPGLDKFGLLAFTSSQDGALVFENSGHSQFCLKTKGRPYGIVTINPAFTSLRPPSQILDILRKEGLSANIITFGIILRQLRKSTTESINSSEAKEQFANIFLQRFFSLLWNESTIAPSKFKTEIEQLALKIIDGSPLNSSQIQQYLKDRRILPIPCFNILKLVLHFAPQLLSTIAVRSVLHQLYQKGARLSSFNDIIPYLQKDSENILLANFMLRTRLGPVTGKKRSWWFKMATINNKELTVVLFSLIQRQRYIETIKLVKQFHRHSPVALQTLELSPTNTNNSQNGLLGFSHYCLALLASILQGDRPSMTWILARIKSLRWPLLKQLTNPKRLCHLEADHDDGRWLALSLSAALLLHRQRKERIKEFTKSFFYFFDERVRPNAVIISFFLRLLICWAKRKPKEAASIITCEWIDGLVNWMRYRGIRPFSGVFVQLALLVKAIPNSENIAWLARFLSRSDFMNRVPTISLYKALLGAARKGKAPFVIQEEIFKAAQRAGTILPDALFEDLITLALNEGRWEDACIWIEDCLKKGTRLNNDCVFNVLTILLNHLAIEKYVKLALALKNAKYSWPKSVRTTMLHFALENDSFDLAQPLLTKGCLGELKVDNEQAQKLINMAIKNGDINGAYGVWSSTPLKEEMKFSKFLAQCSIGNLFFRKSKVTSSIDILVAGEIFYYALAKDHTPAANWCAEVLEKCLEKGEFELAAAIHLYLVTKHEFMPSVALRVARLWRMARRSRNGPKKFHKEKSISD